MIHRTFSAALAASLTAGCLLADFSYQQESKMTGGVMAGMMKVAGAFSKQAREPMRSTVAVKGNRMFHQTGNTAQIIDLDRQIITNVDFDKKTYSEMTFAEFAQAMEKLAQKAQQSKDGQNVDMSMEASVKETGQTRTIQGMDARQVILSMEMKGKDRESGQEGGMLVISNMWLAPKVSGYEEVTNFYKRMGEKIAWTPGSNMMAMGRSDVAKGFANLYKEAAKMEGMPLLQIVTMRPKMDPATEKQLEEAMAKQDPNAPPPAQPEGPSAGQVAGDAAGSAAAGAATSRMGRLGGLGGLGGGFGGFGRRKKKQQEEEQQQAPAQQQQGAPQGSAALIEMTMNTNNFSTDSVDASKFEVPSGFKKVESDMQKALR